MAGRRPGSRRGEIADAALRIIATRGVASLTTTALADELGLTSGALFRHYASREAILDEVAARVEATLLGDIPPPQLPPPERLARFVRQRSATAAGKPGVLRLMTSEQFAFALPQGAARRIRGVVATTQRFLVSTLREGAAARMFRDDVAPEELAVVVMGVTQMLAFLHDVGAGPRSDDRTAKVVAALETLLAPAKTPRTKR